MSNPFTKILNWVSKHFSKDASKMLIWTGVAGWTLSSLAQIGALLFNPKISNEKKSFLIPQELADAAVNIGAFFLVTQLTKRTVSKMFSTGKWAPKAVRNKLNESKELYKNKIGKLDFNLDDVVKNWDTNPKDNYYHCKNFYTTVATIGAGILSSNIITPIVRNNMASKMQKNYIHNKKQAEMNTPKVQTPVVKSTGMRI